MSTDRTFPLATGGGFTAGAATRLRLAASSPGAALTTRRRMLRGLLAGATLGSALGCTASVMAASATPAGNAAFAGAGTRASEKLVLDPAQSRLFRAWMVRIIGRQFSGPTPRWQQRDCVGLVRFAVAEALREHDAKWKRANGLLGQAMPAEITLAAAQQGLRHSWRLADGSRSAYASALELVQGNTRFCGKNCNLAQPGDLLFYDQGEARHLMVWMGAYIAYHTGTVTPDDNGLRALTLRELLHFSDTRWQPTQDNPNFAGIYRFEFLTA